MKRTILFVCNGNMERSPIAEKVTRKLLAARNLEKEIEVFSRGIQGTGGTLPTRFRRPTEYPEEWSGMEPALREYKIDLTQHISTPITEEDVSRATVVIAMEKLVINREVNGLCVQFPEVSGKIRLFSELAGNDEDVPDGYEMGDRETHRAITKMIVDVLTVQIDTLIVWVKEV